MSASFSRAQKRRLEAATDAADNTIKADANFFRRFPDRNHMVRPASKAELEANAAALREASFTAPPGLRWFVAVKQVAPGARVRAFIANSPDSEWDMPEAAAAYVYHLAAGETAIKLEASLRLALRKRGGA